jgi:hypothetical protein
MMTQSKYTGRDDRDHRKTRYRNQGRHADLPLRNPKNKYKQPPTAQRVYDHKPLSCECWTAGAAQRGMGSRSYDPRRCHGLLCVPRAGLDDVLLRVVQFAPLDGAKFMSPRFNRGKLRTGTRVATDRQL